MPLSLPCSMGTERLSYDRFTDQRAGDRFPVRLEACTYRLHLEPDPRRSPPRASASSPRERVVGAGKRGEFAGAWGSPSISIRVGKSLLDRSEREVAVNFRDTIPVEGALAYHLVTNGVPDIEIGVDLFESIDAGAESVSVGGGHEVLEMIGDPGANGWKEKQDGTGCMVTEEVVDVVQNTFYAGVGGISVPNFLLPSYFIPASKGPWDYLRRDA